MFFVAPLRCVFRKEIQPTTGQQLLVVMVFPQELQFAQAQRSFRLIPKEEKFPQRQNSWLSFVGESEGLVESVRSMLATGATNPLQERHIHFQL